MFSLANAESRMAARSPPTTTTNTQRRKPLTAPHPSVVWQRAGRRPPKAAGPHTLADVITVRRSRGHVTWKKVTTVIRPSPDPPSPALGGGSGKGAGLALDRRGDQAPPLGPGAV